MLVQAVHYGFRIGEISCPARYVPEASSISFTRSVRYGLGVLQTSAGFRLHRAGLLRSAMLVGDEIPDPLPFPGTVRMT